MSLKTGRKMGLIVAIAASAALFACIGCTGGPGFHVNPTTAPARSVGPAPTAEVVRTVPFEEAQSLVRTPVARPTPTPQFAYLVEATQYPVPEPVPADTPGARLLQAFMDVERESSYSVDGTFYWPGAAGEEETEIKVYGDYVLHWNGYSSLVWTSQGLSQPEFRLLYSRAGDGSGSPVKSEIVARQGRIVTDTTSNNLKTYRTVAAWRADPDPDKILVNSAVFLSLALTGGRDLQGVFTAWLFWAARGNVQERFESGPGGDEVAVYEVNGHFLGRYAESKYQEWLVRMDSEGRPAHIELTIDTIDPAKNVRGAVDITYTGEQVQ